MRFLPAFSAANSYTPTESFNNKAQKFSKKFFSFLSFSDNANSGNDFSHGTPPTNNRPRSRRLKGFLRKSILLPVIVLAVFGIIGTFMVVSSFRNTGSATGTMLNTGDKRLEIEKPKAQQKLNKQFLFPLKDAAGKEVSKLKFIIEDVEKRDEIVVKGNKATSVKGRTFLVINMKLTNDYEKAVQINTRDYIRLSMNGTSERLAADIHNDPVEIQAISTKFTRVGFPIYDTDKDLVLQIGEINGNKENIKLNLK